MLTATLAAIVSAQDYTRLIPISAHNAGGAMLTDTFGVHAGATYCNDGRIDDTLWEIELPIFPHQVLDFRFMEHRTGSFCMGNGQRVHIQEDDKLDTFRLRIQPGAGGYPITLTWRRVNLWRILTMRDRFGGIIVNTDMLLDTSLEISNPIITMVDIIGIPYLTDAPGPAEIPVKLILHQNYPNPFNPTTTISYDLESAGWVSVIVLDVLGRKIATLVDRYQHRGAHAAVWDASGEAGGVYFYRARLNGVWITKSMCVMK